MRGLIISRSLVRAYRLLRWLVVGLFIGAAFMAAMIQAAHAQFIITHERDEALPNGVAWVPVTGQAEGATAAAACAVATADVSVFAGVEWGQVTGVVDGVCSRQINGAGSFPFALVGDVAPPPGPVPCATALACAQETAASVAYLRESSGSVERFLIALVSAALAGVGLLAFVAGNQR